MYVSVIFCYTARLRMYAAENTSRLLCLVRVFRSASRIFEHPLSSRKDSLALSLSLFLLHAVLHQPLNMGTCILSAVTYIRKGWQFLASPAIRFKKKRLIWRYGSSSIYVNMTSIPHDFDPSIGCQQKSLKWLQQSPSTSTRKRHGVQVTKMIA